MGQREVELEKKRTLICDVFCGYSEESGNARFDQTFMRDIIAYFKFGHFVHATAATHLGEPVPIGQDAASAKTSKYDEERLKRLERIHIAQKEAKEAEDAQRARDQSAAAASSSAAPAPTLAGDSKHKVHKQRATAGKSKSKASKAAAADGEKVMINVPEGVTPGQEITVIVPDGQKVTLKVPEGAESGQRIEVEIPIDVSTNRRGKLPYMRLILKWTDGCGVQYVQREAALGTASLFGDIEMHAPESMMWRGVMGMHVVFPPYNIREKTHSAPRCRTLLLTLRVRSAVPGIASNTSTTPRARSLSTIRTRA
jgi:hypothetical protein